MNRTIAMAQIKQNGLPNDVKNSLLKELEKRGKISFCIECGEIAPKNVSVITHENCGGYVIRLGREISF